MKKCRHNNAVFRGPYVQWCKDCGAVKFTPYGDSITRWELPKHKPEGGK